MSGFWRALLISAVATGAAAVALKLLKPESAASPAAGRPGPYVDAEEMTTEERDLLMQELQQQL